MCWRSRLPWRLRGLSWRRLNAEKLRPNESQTTHTPAGPGGGAGRRGFGYPQTAKPELGTAELGGRKEIAGGPARERRGPPVAQAGHQRAEPGQKRESLAGS